MNRLLQHRFLFSFVVCFLGLTFGVGLLPAQEDEDADFLTGVLGHYQSGEVAFDRIDEDIAFDWETGSPDPRLARKAFQVDWTGLLLIRKNIPYRFHAWLAGELTVRVDGRVVLEASRKQPGWVSGEEITLPFGDQELEIHYRKLDNQAAVKLYWSSTAFPLEPIPTGQFFREEPNLRAYQMEQGKQIVEAFRCNQCHQPGETGLSQLTAPSLKNLQGGVQWDWLVNKLENPQHQNQTSRMPDFGFDEEDASAVAAYLWSSSSPPNLNSLPALPKPEKAKKKKGNKQKEKPFDPHTEGENLVHSLGCLACHRQGDQGQSELFSGPELTHLKQKRSSEWVLAWMQNPENLNSAHRMPTYELTTQEQNLIARYLSEPTTEKTLFEAPEFKQEQIDRGKKLVAEANCRACHELGDKSENSFSLPAINVAKLSEPASCLTPAQKDSKQPYYQDRFETEQLKAYLESIPQQLVESSLYEQGRHLLTRKNCLACHQRGAQNGLKDLAGEIASSLPALKGQSQALVPPTMTAVGDKLIDSVLEKSVSGEQERVRVGWLDVRMPKFRHTDAEKEALLTYLVGHDRIPEEAPELPPLPAPSSETQEDWFITGQALIGARGFSCIACHQVGEYQPKNVAPGTRGSDLLQIGQRMRKPFFGRWVRSPIRIVAGMEMPSFNRPKKEVLEGHLPSQLGALWEALNDPRLIVPTDPSVVEQYWTVQPEEPPRVLRDVFLIRKTPGAEEEPVAHSMGIGLNNGHSALVDLSLPALRLWTLGDFARQRTVGKSWFWDMAGTPLGYFEPVPDYALSKGEQIIAPNLQGDSRTKLLSYRTVGNQVELQYLIHFQLEGKIHDLRVLETYKPMEQTGWERETQVENIPDGYQLVLTVPLSKVSFGSPQVELSSAIPHQLIAGASEDSGFQQVRFTGTMKRIAARWTYSAAVKSPALIADLKQNQKYKLEPVETLPGFDGVRLPLPRSIMPTAMAVMDSGKLAITSLKGHVYIASDSDGDGYEDQLELFEEGLAAPFGVVAVGNDLIVSHKPEAVRLSDTDGDGRADQRKVLASGWGYTEDYHDWTCGIVKDSDGWYYLGVGSDYAQKKRPDISRTWRGKVIRFNDEGQVEPVGHSFRYPIGLAIDGRDNIFVSDQQGVQNSFNEINHLVPGKYYGVWSYHDRENHGEETRASVQIPHPWTRSVNGIFMLPDDYPVKALAGQGIGCEYNGQFLIRFNMHPTQSGLQGSTYYFSQPDQVGAETNFLGPISGTVGKDGSIYIGSIHDSGWLGGANIGEIVKLKPNGKLPNGIRTIRAVPEGFEIEFFEPVDPELAQNPQNYTLSAYTRVWGGAYATPDSGRHTVEVSRVELKEEARVVRLTVTEQRPGYVYEISCGEIGVGANQKLWPTTGHYTLNSLLETDSDN